MSEYSCIITASKYPSIYLHTTLLCLSSSKISFFRLVRLFTTAGIGSVYSISRALSSTKQVHHYMIFPKQYPRWGGGGGFFLTIVFQDCPQMRLLCLTWANSLVKQASMKDFFLCHQRVGGSPHVAMVLVCVPSGASVVGDMSVRDICLWSLLCFLIYHFLLTL